MAGSLNRVELIGNLGADPEVRTLQGGGKVANLSIATSESWTDKQSNEKKERTEWHRVTIWNEKLVEIVQKYCKKGDKIFVEGQMQTRKYQKDGIDHYATEVVLSGFNGRVLLLGGKGGGQSDPNDNANRPGNSASSSAPAQTQTPAQVYAAADDDIPF